MANITVSVSAAEAAALLAVTGHDPLTFFTLRLQDITGAFDADTRTKKAALYKDATPAEKTQLDTIFTAIAARKV